MTSACHSSLGRSAQKRLHEERGRFWGCRTTNPRRLRMRQIVEVAGALVTAGSRARCSAMVAALFVVFRCAPAEVESSRSVKARSGLIRNGELLRTHSVLYTPIVVLANALSTVSAMV